MPWTWLWVVVASRKTCIYQGCGSVLGALGPYLSLSAATWFPGPEDQLPLGTSYCCCRPARTPGLEA